MLDTIVSGGQVVTPSGVVTASIAIKDGRIVALAHPGVSLEAERVIDVGGKIVIPGVVDPHVHVRTYMSLNADTLGSASLAAAYGGVTTLLVFVGTTLPQHTPEGVIYPHIDTAGLKLTEFFPPIIQEWQRTAYTDFGIHPMLFADPELIAQIPAATQIGITSFKMIMGYRKSRENRLDDNFLYAAMTAIASCGGMAMIHAENGPVIDFLTDRLVAEERYSQATFLESRPNLVEAEATYRAIAIAKMAGCPLYIVHLSTREGLEVVAQAQARGEAVVAETCPQYLLLTNEDTLRLGPLVKMAPPLRSREDNQALWKGLQQGVITTTGTDHAAFEREGQKLAARTFAEVPYGMPGVETYLPLMYSEGVVKGRLSLTELVKLMCENPARTFGLYPRKGAIQVGADADLVAIDPTLQWSLDGATLHSRAGYTPFQGWQVTGKPVLTMLRGQVLVEQGQLHQGPGYGRYLHRPL